MSHVRITDTLEPAETRAVLDLAESARAHDGVAPLSEQTLLRVRHGAPRGTARFHLAQGPGGRLAGFGYAERAPGAPDSGELVVAPPERRAGLGGALLRSLAADAAPEGVRVWAHGRLEGAVALARSAGWSQARGLLKMRLRLRGGDPGSALGEAVLPQPVLSDTVARELVIRPFRPGADDDAWVAANAEAFADHPEQGALTAADLRQRAAEDWFDPEGFFVAEETATGAVAGFHWTKVHADGAGLAEEPVGEVYVVGVRPAWRRTGLGRVLTLIGLRHLRDRGLPWVLLYVDEENRAAVRLYESLGFSVWDADVMYAAP
ncbi:mycothiol synthase [Streptomonospora nanhaiensis]|uniref:Mycothiol acetyltransferase n=1 Tax=Streptomonospora nanhaiensis TaxID=1323731 RepID=A0A853BP93_9ACTN|nr:mycothiol synthase [Streptomonospora nanhaiensis]MBV2365960.1 mycothiol synthase [Streptomonospora nanhaiensis]MBX9388862.1 mycothiol synthase [Streptomonospora nanhaiensis]NYI96604.1 mycothiol synthase [Streptomonospora nanhaiensis]